MSAQILYTPRTLLICCTPFTGNFVTTLSKGFLICSVRRYTKLHQAATLPVIKGCFLKLFYNE